MSQKYKLASVLLSAGLVMAACGGEENEEGSEDNSGASGETEQSTEQSSSEENSENVDETSPDEEMDDSNEADSNGGGNDSGNNTAGDSSGEGAGGTSDTIAQEDISHDAQEAVDTARESFDGELVQVELDRDDGQWIYKVDMEQNTEEYEVKLSMEDLSVVNENTETDDDDDAEDQFEYSAAVPAEDAVQTAIDEAGGSGEIEGWSLDKDDSSLEYEIELKNTDNGDADIKINAESGEVIETDFDNDNEDDD